MMMMHHAIAIPLKKSGKGKTGKKNRNNCIKTGKRCGSKAKNQNKCKLKMNNLYPKINQKKKRYERKTFCKRCKKKFIATGRYCKVCKECDLRFRRYKNKLKETTESGKKRCQYYIERNKAQCRQVAIFNGRCYFHQGK